jgi:glutaconyl-CoA/methylmalonyl-CoA decarboxylase subunit gamma
MSSYKIKINGKSLEAQVLDRSKNSIKFQINEEIFEVAHNHEYSFPSAALIPTMSQTPTMTASNQIPSKATISSNHIVAPMPGLISKVLISKNDAVKSGQTLLVMEAMKMENNITANRNGIINEIKVKVGQEVAAQEVLILIK